MKIFYIILTIIFGVSIIFMILGFIKRSKKVTTDHEDYIQLNKQAIIFEILSSIWGILFCISQLDKF
jgi:hypothetical protein